PPDATLFPYTTLFRSRHGALVIYGTSRSAGGLAQFNSSGYGPIGEMAGRAASPHPDPLPRGEGTVSGSFGCSGSSSSRNRAGFRSEEHTSELQSRSDL